MEKDVAEDKRSIGGIFRKIRKIKHIEIIIALAAVAVMLLIYFSSFSGGSKSVDVGGGLSSKTAVESFYSNYCDEMEARICELVSSIKGAGSAKIVINWESSVELIIAHTENSSTGSSSSSPVVITDSGSSSPIILKEIYPKALGVLIVCAGGGDAKIRVSIIMGVATLLNISSDKIVVIEGKG